MRRLQCLILRRLCALQSGMRIRYAYVEAHEPAVTARRRQFRPSTVCVTQDATPKQSKVLRAPPGQKRRKGTQRVSPPSLSSVRRLHAHTHRVRGAQLTRGQRVSPPALASAAVPCRTCTLRLAHFPPSTAPHRRARTESVVTQSVDCCTRSDTLHKRSRPPLPLVRSPAASRCAATCP